MLGQLFKTDFRALPHWEVRHKTRRVPTPRIEEYSARDLKRLRSVRPLFRYAGEIKYKVDAWTQLMSTELNSLAATTAALQATGTNAAYDNGTNLNFWGDFELAVTYAVAPTGGKTIDLYVIPLSSAGGTTYEDGSASITPATLYVGSWITRGVATAQNLMLRGVPLPPDKFIVVLSNNADQAFSASGNTVKVHPYREQYT